jgi:carbamoyl-phosphate synthase large subunit
MTIIEKLSKGHSIMIDIIDNLIVNVLAHMTTYIRIPLRGGFQIHPAAANKQIPCFTSLDTVLITVEVLSNENQIYSVRPLLNISTKESE